MKISDEWKSVLTWTAIITLIYTIASATVANLRAEIDQKADIVAMEEVKTDMKTALNGIQNVTYLLGYNTARMNILLSINGIPTDTTGVTMKVKK